MEDYFRKAFIAHAQSMNIYDFKIESIEVKSEHYAVAQASYWWMLNSWRKDVSTQWHCTIIDGFFSVQGGLSISQFIISDLSEGEEQNLN